ncbi:peptide deformylase [Kitasatospora sp. NPDC087314]|uniref:peptide deformylase n=1 Tax=Kitasatospora sp. NPDC087314 TaxID=3364068 RepID=UPI0037FDB2E6
MRPAGAATGSSAPYGCPPNTSWSASTSRPTWTPSTALDGSDDTETYERGRARLVAHEIDHLDGLLYTDRMRPGVTPIPVEEFRGTGSTRIYRRHRPKPSFQLRTSYREESP